MLRLCHCGVDCAQLCYQLGARTPVPAKQRNGYGPCVQVLVLDFSWPLPRRRGPTNERSTTLKISRTGLKKRKRWRRPPIRFGKVSQFVLAFFGLQPRYLTWLLVPLTRPASKSRPHCVIPELSHMFPSKFLYSTPHDFTPNKDYQQPFMGSGCKQEITRSLRSRSHQFLIIMHFHQPLARIAERACLISGESALNCLTKP